MTKSRGIRKPRIKLTPEQIEVIRSRYPHERTAVIAADLGFDVKVINNQMRQLGLSKSPEYLASPAACRLRRGDNIGAAHRFPKGHVSANKNIKGVHIAGCEKTWFPKGHKPQTWRPIGTERMSKEGYLQVKISDTGVSRRDYVSVHQLVWQLHHGAIPERHHVSFKDGDRTHITLDNLELVSYADMMRRNTIHNLPEELKEILHLQGSINRRITCHERYQRIKKTSV
jgi:hypothetical protein